MSHCSLHTEYWSYFSSPEDTEHEYNTNKRSGDRFEHEFPHVTSKYPSESKSWCLVTGEDLLAAM